MDAIKNLLGSEKGLVGVALILAATVLTALGHITPDAWISYTEWIFGIYVGGKTIQGAAAVLAEAKAKAPAAGPANVVVNQPTTTEGAS